MPFNGGGFRWTIASRTVGIAWAAVVVTAAAGLLIQRSVIRNQGIALVRSGMSDIVLSAESQREAVSRLNVSGAFDRRSLVDEATKAADYRQTTLYSTIPVVAAWRSIQKVADERGYEFRTPSFNPRNARNTPDAQETQILNQLAAGNMAEYFEVDPKRNQIIYARPIRLSEDCMMCHGDPAGHANGKDIVGFRMEGWRAGELHGAFLLRATMAPVHRQVRAGMWTAALWLIPVAVAVGVCAYLVSRRVRAPLAEAVRVLQSIAAGNLTAEVKTRNNDETGDMAEAMHTMSGSLRAMIQEAGQ